MSKGKIAVSFSGGRSSAVMTKVILDTYGKTHDIQVTFANTGWEHPDTLRFINDCDKHWGFNTVWLEAVITQTHGVGVRHRIVDYTTASRNGEPFEQYIKKYGIPSNAFKNCTSRLKTNVMESYLKSVGYYRGKRLNYDTAIGIRSDEVDRVSARKDEYRFIYPLVTGGWTKKSVNEYMSQFDFDLKIPEHFGNCVGCFKKSNRKLMTLCLQIPEAFDFAKRMEHLYGHVKSESTREDGRRVFYRSNVSTEELMEMAKTTDFDMFGPDVIYDDLLDMGSGCEESCEPYPTDGT